MCAQHGGSQHVSLYRGPPREPPSSGSPWFVKHLSPSKCSTVKHALLGWYIDPRSIQHAVVLWALLLCCIDSIQFLRLKRKEKMETPFLLQSAAMCYWHSLRFMNERKEQSFALYSNASFNESALYWPKGALDRLVILMWHWKKWLI